MGLYLAYDSEQEAPAQDRDHTRPKLMIAIRPEDVALSRLILGNEFDVVFCHTYEEARKKLDDSVQLITCGVHFDNGKVFDLLRFVRETPDFATLPFFILLGAESRYSSAIVQGIRAAAQLLKVTGFTDLTRFVDKFGKEASAVALRKGIRDAIAEHAASRAGRPSVSSL